MEFDFRIIESNGRLDGLLLWEEASGSGLLWDMPGVFWDTVVLFCDMLLLGDIMVGSEGRG